MKKTFHFLKRYQATILLCTLSFTFVCCSKKYLIPIQADVAIAQKHWQGTTMEQLNKGYAIYTDKCTDCHGLKKPQKFSIDDWNTEYMPKMGRKAKLDSAEYVLVLHYILTKREEITTPKK